MYARRWLCWTEDQYDKLFQQVYDCDSKLVEPDMHERSDKNIDWLLDSRTNGIEETKNGYYCATGESQTVVNCLLGQNRI